MQTLKKFILTAATLSMTSVAFCQSIAKVPTIGIVVPLEHRAMTEIVRGFKQELAKQYPHPVVIEVKNAEHDLMVERAIVTQFKEQQVNIVEPIGTDAFDMAMASITQRPIVGIAAAFSAKDRAARVYKNVTNVDDELSSATQLKFMRQACPHIHTVTLIHSADAKMFSEVKAFKQAALEMNIGVEDLTVQQASDLYTLSQHVNANTQALFILKDHFIVSGVATLVKQAELRHIPVVASDDGSVQGGAAFALGVRESDIGRVSADVTAEILKGKPVAAIPTRFLERYQVFINSDQAKAQGVDVAALKKAAAADHYGVILYHTQRG